jgi:hypothetical protein
MRTLRRLEVNHWNRDLEEDKVLWCATPNELLIAMYMGGPSWICLDEPSTDHEKMHWMWGLALQGPKRANKYTLKRAACNVGGYSYPIANHCACCWVFLSHS